MVRKIFLEVFIATLGHFEVGGFLRKNLRMHASNSLVKSYYYGRPLYKIQGKSQTWKFREIPYSRPARRKFNPFFFCQTCLDSGFLRFMIGATQILKGSSQLRLGLKNEPIEKNKQMGPQIEHFFA